MRMILAIKNNSLEEKIINRYYSEYEIYIAQSIELIKKSLCNNSILIIRDEIIKNNQIKSFIESVKENFCNIQIIILVKALSKTLKEFLFSKEVFSIIEGTSISFNCLSEMIDNPKMIVYKEKKIEEKKRVVIITGGFSTGKSTISKLIAMSISKRHTVALIDMNYMHPTVDLHVNTCKNYAIEELAQDIEEKNNIKINKYITDDDKLPNLKYILNKGNSCIPSDIVLTKIIEIAKSHFDYVVIDTSSFMINKVYNISQKNNYNIIHLIEPDVRGIKNYMEDIKYIDKTQIHDSIIVLNKYLSYFKIKKFEKKYKFKDAIHFKFSYTLLFTNKIKMFLFYFSIEKILYKLKFKKENILNYRRNRNE